MAQLLHIFPSFEVGGAQRRLATLLSLGLQGHTHTILSLDGNREAEALLPSNRDNIQILDHIRLPKSATFEAIKTARRHLKILKPDLMLTYNWGSIEWDLANSIRPICPGLHIQDGFGLEEQTRELQRRLRTRRWAYKRAVAVIVPSLVLRDLAREHWRIAPTKLHHIPNGVDMARFEVNYGRAVANAFGLTEQDFIIGTVASLRPEKNLTLLIDSFRRFLDDLEDAQFAIKLVIVGNGSERTRLEQHAREKGLADTVIFTGNLDKPEKILPIFDIFALTSLTEQMPMAVMEAMAAGLPIVSTDVGDVRHILSRENNGLLSAPTPESLARSMRTLTANPDLAASIGQRNREKAQREFSLTRMIDAYEALIKDALGPNA